MIRKRCHIFFMFYVVIKPPKKITIIKENHKSMKLKTKETRYKTNQSEQITNYDGKKDHCVV